MTWEKIWQAETVNGNIAYLCVFRSEAGAVLKAELFIIKKRSGRNYTVSMGLTLMQLEIFKKVLGVELK